MGNSQPFPISTVPHQVQALLIGCANKRNKLYRKSSEDDNDGNIFTQLENYSKINSSEFKDEIDEMSCYSLDVMNMSKCLSKWFSCKQIFFCQQIQDEKQTSIKQQIMEQITSSFNQNHYNATLLYFSGNGKEKTGDLMLEYNQEQPDYFVEYITFKEVYSLWKERKSKQKFLLIILDSSYSGGWIQQLQDLLRQSKSVDYSISIYASSKIDQLAYESTKNGGIFTHNILTTLLDNKKFINNLIDQFEVQDKQNSQFYGLQFRMYENFGLPLLFTKISDMQQFLLKQGWINQKYVNGDIYDGMINQYKVRNGLGIFTYHNRNKYIGEFVNGQYQGRGIMQYTEFCYYEGEWELDLRHGLGSEYYQNGDYYEGEWRYGKKHGYGIYFFYNGDKYEGDFINDKSEGQGTIYYKSGAKYIGQWKDDLKNGKGFFYYNDGSTYQGEFKNGKSDGYGIEIYKSGNRYEGQFKEDCKSGKGIYYYKNGDKEEGEWLDNQQKGLQILFKNNGEREEKFY